MHRRLAANALPKAASPPLRPFLSTTRTQKRFLWDVRAQLPIASSFAAPSWRRASSVVGLREFSSGQMEMQMRAQPNARPNLLQTELPAGGQTVGPWWFLVTFRDSVGTEMFIKG